jgi:hypothetical protein
MDIGARVFNDANISIAVSGLWTALTFNSERYDTDNMHSLTVNTGRLTSRRAAKYFITGHVEWAVSANLDRTIGIRLNGATRIGEHNTESFATYEVIQSVATIYDLGVGDYVELFVFQNSGAALNVLVNPYHSPEFSITMLEDIGCRAYRNADVSIPNNVWTAVDLNAERWDTDGMHDNATNPSRITCQTEGYYAMTANIAFTSQVSGYRAVRIVKNGTDVIATSHVDASGTSNALSTATVYFLEVGDYVELEVLTFMGVPQTLRYYAQYSPELAVQKIMDQP